ncbi:hypothetical protein Cob_v000149 [Colletotrichum orbiculare MAFF 240422]|uniref:Uncharacterized protein n=1 Tax=Colletotrichum orbiculare (strain 104-T / ATCC 96160 / CBS 514.97 / LARS 414 / MAFF 240422) TaxID=1213857 RepID=A0A484G6N3_COLOR|nr:hypothetical protein Cob_v000149 [Colletotrichum orbiculare MAFF 240422]
MNIPYLRKHAFRYFFAEVRPHQAVTLAGQSAVGRVGGNVGHFAYLLSSHHTLAMTAVASLSHRAPEIRRGRHPGMHARWVEAAAVAVKTQWARPSKTEPTCQGMKLRTGANQRKAKPGREIHDVLAQVVGILLLVFRIQNSTSFRGAFSSSFSYEENIALPTIPP